MTARLASAIAIVTSAAALGSVAAAQPPRITNGAVHMQAAGSPFIQSFRTLVSAQSDVAWIGYFVPAARGGHPGCPCCIEPEGGMTVRSSSAGRIELEGPSRLVLLYRVVDRQVERIRAYPEGCELDAGGRPVRWLDRVRPADSIALLESFVGADGDRRSRTTSGALAAIAMHADPSAAATVERLARHHATAPVRAEAIFWLGQMAGRKAAGVITEAIEKDPDTEVKKRAVFALSQLPTGEGVPLLIKVARENANPVVRRQAMFWLGQSKDPRAIDFFAEILR
ncbi:MAG: hypothetical protein A3H96_25845 [Acidobacteria bacterium RIFCSPLOWO2_02_FULL_67_36]|nr:MAG: hypothetical protein A3H96_25845 [Acidobacteria bacterium RIFCSPLOWO2_02_FULL_67_36]OFW23428.1 MAG: hypothetical protein A3G21_05675 [Acidobacteria bacterium RIFCSPLOWO2_12_FULL_66_21]